MFTALGRGRLLQLKCMDSAVHASPHFFADRDNPAKKSFLQNKIHGKINNLNTYFLLPLFSIFFVNHLVCFFLLNFPPPPGVC